MSVMYAAQLGNGAYLQALADPAYSFGTGDFTLGAMVMGSTPGPLLSRKDDSTGGSEDGGFLLTVDAGGAVRFVTYDGVGYWQANTGPTGILDGSCHTVMAVRRGGSLGILIDGLPVAVQTDGNRVSPLNVNNSLPLLIGATALSSENAKQLTGTLMNVGIWNFALSEDALVRAAFARVSASDAGLQGYWTLDQTNADISANDNPANMSGPVTFAPCLTCVWAAGSGGYSFCRVTNMPDVDELDADAASTTVALTRVLTVPTGSPALMASIMAQADQPAFPSGATVSLVDPSGHSYNANANTDTVCVVTSGGQPWSVTVLSPQAGQWRLTVTAPVGTGFALQLNTVPTTSVVETVETALAPLYQEAPEHVLAHEQIPGGWLSLLKTIAVSAAVGVVVGAAVVLSGGTALPAIAVALAAFTYTTAVQAQEALHTISSSNLTQAADQVAGMAGFVVAPQRLLLIDANTVEDGHPETQLMYSRRKKKLYPYVTASTFCRVQQSLIAGEDTRENVAAQLKSFNAGYVTATGHGMWKYLTGWFVKGCSGPLQEILSVGHYEPVEAAGKIFHIFGCWTGYKGPSGLGRDLVANGAVAFFGYCEQFMLPASQYMVFCDCDIAIDMALIDGKTCDEAYRAAIAVYNAHIKRYESNGDYGSAAYLTKDRDRLVCPSTEAAYGNMNARLDIGSGEASREES